MSEVQFEENYNSSNFSGGYQNKGLANWLINKGIAKDEKTAQIILIAVTVAAFILAFYFISKNPADSREKVEIDPNTPSFEEAIRKSQW